MPTHKGRSPGQILIIGLLSLYFEDGASPGLPDPPTLPNTRRSRTAVERMPTMKMYTSRRSRNNLGQEPLIQEGEKLGGCMRKQWVEDTRHTDSTCCVLVGDMPLRHMPHTPGRVLGRHVHLPRSTPHVAETLNSS